MKDLRFTIFALLAGLAVVFSGCGSSSSGPGPDPDGDGVPTVRDSFPDDPSRFAAFLTHDLVVPQGAGLFSAALDVNDDANPLIVGSAERTANPGTLQAVQWTFDSASGTPVAAIPLNAVDGTYSASFAVNAAGTIVGEAADGAQFVPVFWTGESLDPTPLSTAVRRTELVEIEGVPTEVTVFDDPLTKGAAYGINDLGQIVGELERADGTLMAVLWSFDEELAMYVPVELPSLGGANASAIAISDGGWVVGESVTDVGAIRATLWEIGPGGLLGDAIDLGILLGHVKSIALDVDNEGRIVGESEDSAGQVSAVLWTPAAGGLYESQSRGLHASAQAINDGTRFVGHAGQGDAARAVVWDVQTTLANNFDHVVTGAGPTFTPVEAFSQAYGMNQANMVVGIAGNQAFFALPQ